MIRINLQKLGSIRWELARKQLKTTFVTGLIGGFGCPVNVIGSLWVLNHASLAAMFFSSIFSLRIARLNSVRILSFLSKMYFFLQISSQVKILFVENCFQNQYLAKIGAYSSSGSIFTDLIFAIAAFLILLVLLYSFSFFEFHQYFPFGVYFRTLAERENRFSSRTHRESIERPNAAQSILLILFPISILAFLFFILSVLITYIQLKVFSLNILGFGLANLVSIMLIFLIEIIKVERNRLGQVTNQDIQGGLKSDDKAD